MEKLDVRTVEDKGDICSIYRLACGLSFDYACGFFVPSEKRVCAVARFGGVDVGFWDGEISDIEGGRVFHSEMIYASELFRNRGIGFRVKRNQLETARTMGCSRLYSSVYVDNKSSLAIQRKLGGKIYDVSDEGIDFYFDL